MFGVLGPVMAWDAAGAEIALRGPRHQAVLARLIVARGRIVPVGHLVDDLWTAPPPGAVSSVRTFVAALRRALEPSRAPRSRPTVLVTEGPGYALRATPSEVDAWRFEDAVAAGTDLDEALGWWRGPAYANFAEEPWARAERTRLTELRLRAIEMQGSQWLSAGRLDALVPMLDAHVIEHPWREEGWRLLALALYRSGRQGDALAVLRRARELLSARLGIDPGPSLRALEVDILRQEPHLADSWSSVAQTFARLAGPRARLETAVGLLRSLAVTGGGPGLDAAQEQRLATIRAAAETGDPALTARVIGAYDVPAIWPRPDDPDRAAEVVAAARRTLAAVPSGAERARLLATIAIESRGTGDPADRAAAREAEAIARRLDDPRLLAFALNGTFMQSFGRCGLAPERDAIGAELIEVAGRAGLPAAEVLGHLIRMQSLGALGDFGGAAGHADAADVLAERHELALVGVFTTWFRALRLAASGADSDEAYRLAESMVDRAGMPGLTGGLVPLVALAAAVRDRRPVPSADYGPYQPWIGADPPDPPHDPLAEALWALACRGAVLRGDRVAAARARAALRPAAAELAGAASGLITLGPVAGFLEELDDFLG